MNTEDLLQIKMTRVINAPRWRVIRMLTKVWEFSDNVDTIKEVSVIEKNHNIIKTKWHIIVDDLPMTWLEEDTLDLKNNRITFRALEGDLQEFRGAWKFEDHPEGTEVTVNVFFFVGIPIVEQFTSEYIRPLVKKNFEKILESLEARLVSQRYASFRDGNKNKVAGFGVLGHFYNFNHMVESFKMLNPDFKIPSPGFLGELFRVTPSFTMHEMNEFKSKTGETTHGQFILCTFIPDMVDHNLEAVYDKVVRACKLAEKSGVGIVTLGGFASIVGERLGKRITDDVDIPLTTGNAYTSALAVEGIEKAAELLGKDLKELKVVVVGGTGDIGSACARVLCEKVKEITITGRTLINLVKMGYELKKQGKAKVRVSRNNKRAIKDADIVIAAANSSASILKIDWFKSGSIVCDLAYPKNLSYTSKRKDIFVFSGGLASVPTPINPGNDIGVPSSDICYGCFCEVIILALEHRYENFSFGRGNITKANMEEIRALGLKHGFELAPFFWANGMVTKEDISEIKKAAVHV